MLCLVFVFTNLSLKEQVLPMASFITKKEKKEKVLFSISKKLKTEMTRRNKESDSELFIIDWDLLVEQAIIKGIKIINKQTSENTAVSAFKNE